LRIKEYPEMKSGKIKKHPEMKAGKIRKHPKIKSGKKEIRFKSRNLERS
jgi:hypothetical protein